MLSITCTLILIVNNYFLQVCFGSVFIPVTASFQCGQGAARGSAGWVLLQCVQ